MNSLTLKGNLGGDVEIRTVGAKAISVANFSMAVSEYKGKNEDGTSKYESFWVKVVVWGKLAEKAAGSLKKGDSVVVQGKLSIRTWDKEGVKQYSTEVIAAELTKAQRLGASTSSPDESLFDSGDNGYSGLSFGEES
jgi:single-strand DNA-binding protein